MSAHKQKSQAHSAQTPAARTKKIIIAAAIAAALIALVAGVVLLMPSKEFTVAFYRVADHQRQGITETVTALAQEKGISPVFVQYDPDKSLKEQIPLAKKPSLIFTTSGFALETAAERASPAVSLSPELSQGMTSSMRSAITQKDGRIIALPILSSHFEVDIDEAEYRSSKIEGINIWNDVEKFAREQKQRKESPVLFAGGDSETFLDLLGAFAESIDGVSSYSAAADIIRGSERNFNPARVAIRLCNEPDSPLATTVRRLRSWYKLGFIHQGVFSLQKNDVEAFASSRLSSILFMSLEDHRDAAQKTISRYKSIYFPPESRRSANSRIFSGKTYYAIPLTKSAAAQSLAAELLSPAAQEAMSRATGLAPVLAQCRTPDRQSYDARFWIAATSAPLAGLSSEAFLSKQQKAALAAEIASRIRN